MGRWGITLGELGVAVVVVVASACGSKDRSFGDGSSGGGANGGGPDIGAGDSVVVEPADVVLNVADGTPPPTQSYQAFLVHADGSRVDETVAAHFSVDGTSYGGFNGGATFTAAPQGVGKTTVHAAVGALTGSTGLSLHLTTSIVAGGAPPDAGSKFGGAADPARAPGVAYPPDGVLVPPNMNVLEWQYTPGAGNDLFDLAVTSPLLDLHVYFGCSAISGGCAFSPDAGVWSIVSSAGRGDDPLSYTLRGTSSTGGGGGTVGAAAARTIAFGQEDINGGLYYWNAGAGATMRYEFGVSGQKAETYMDPAKAGAATCVGCHVLSRDGAHISLGLDIPGPAAYKVFDVASRTMIFGSAPGPGANFFSFSPDNTQLMVSNGVTLSLRDAATGAAIVDTVATGAMPDWSPDGDTVVFASPKTPPPCLGAVCGAPGVSEASLMIAAKKSGGGGFGAPATLVPSAGQNNYYPSYSPDGAWVAFNRASVGTDAQGDAKTSYDAPDATVWCTPSAVTAAGPTALARATSASGDSWPKWMPVVQNYRGKKLMWLTFSSRRAYGLRLPAGQTAQIWMVAFDPDRAAANADPSFPAFWLPFQEMSSGNHIAQWVTTVARQGCTQSSQCDATESCVNGVCRPTVN